MADLGHDPLSAGPIAGTSVAAAIAGTASITLGAVTLSATSAVAIVGTLSKTLADATLSATGAVNITGSAAITLGAVTLAATGALPIVGTEGGTLANVTLSAAGVLAVAGTASITLDGVTLVATGELGALPATANDGGGSQAAYRAMGRNERRRKRRETEALTRLRATLERAARKAFGEPEPDDEAVAAIEEAREIIAQAPTVDVEARAQNVATLAEITAAIGRLEALLAAEVAQQEDEEAAEMLLLAA